MARKSRGTPLESFRCPPELSQAVKAYCKKTADRRVKGELTFTEFCVAALREKMAHIERSKKTRRPKLKSEVAADALVAQLFSHVRLDSLQHDSQSVPEVPI